MTGGPGRTEANVEHFIGVTIRKISPNLPFPLPHSIGILHHRNQSTKYHSKYEWYFVDDTLLIDILDTCFNIKFTGSVSSKVVKSFIWTPLYRLICSPLNDNGQIVHKRFWREFSFFLLRKSIICCGAGGRRVKGEREAKQLKTICCSRRK